MVPASAAVLASGGVPRDYVNLVTAALDKATRRLGETNRPKNRITAEDVNMAVPEFLKQKEDDLRVDVPGEDVERLRLRLYDVLNFCLVHRKSNIFTVDARVLREEQWGRDIAVRSDLRFFHRFGNLTVKSSDPGYVGQRYEGFALDLSGTPRRGCERTSGVLDHGRLPAESCRAYVYTPDISAQLGGVAKAGTSKKTVEPTVELSPRQITIYDALAEVEHDVGDPEEMKPTTQ